VCRFLILSDDNKNIICSLLACTTYTCICFCVWKTEQYGLDDRRIECLPFSFVKKMFATQKPENLRKKLRFTFLTVLT